MFGTWCAGKGSCVAIFGVQVGGKFWEKKEREKMVCMDSWGGRDTGRPRENKTGPGVRVWPERDESHAEFQEVTMGV